MTVRLRLRVTGRVQGVWHRASMAREARQLGLRGWVRNAADGSVEAEAEGPDDALDHLVAWARCGPPGARVEHVRAEPISASPPGDADFVIQH